MFWFVLPDDFRGGYCNKRFFDKKFGRAKGNYFKCIKTFAPAFISLFSPASCLFYKIDFIKPPSTRRARL
jgi:hypothetical protein